MHFGGRSLPGYGKQRSSGVFTLMRLKFGPDIALTNVLNSLEKGYVQNMPAFIHFMVLASFWAFWHFGIMRPKSRHHERAKEPKQRHL